jgi:hypothetical protein
LAFGVCMISPSKTRHNLKAFFPLLLLFTRWITWVINVTRYVRWKNSLNEHFLCASHEHSEIVHLVSSRSKRALYSLVEYHLEQSRKCCHIVGWYGHWKEDQARQMQVGYHQVGLSEHGHIIWHSTQQRLCRTSLRKNFVKEFARPPHDVVTHVHGHHMHLKRNEPIEPKKLRMICRIVVSYN